MQLKRICKDGSEVIGIGRYDAAGFEAGRRGLEERNIGGL